MFRPRLRAPAALGNSCSSSLGGGASSLLARRTAQSAVASLSQQQHPRPSSAPSVRRSIHHLPISRHDVRVGVPNLLSAEGFDLAWTQHMTLVLGRLNQLVTGASHSLFVHLDVLLLCMLTAPPSSPTRRHRL